MFMMRRGKMAAALVAVAALSAGLAVRLRAADDAAGAKDSAAPAAAKSTSAGEGGGRFFEMRTYYAAEGKTADLDARFRNHTNALFQKHGIQQVGYWHPVDKKDVLVYILAYPSREAREQSWKDFSADPDWKKAQGESERNGKLVTKVESVYMTPTDYSAVR